MKVSIPLDVPQEVIDAIVAKAKELGHSIEPRNEKLLVVDTMKALIENNLYVYTHQGMKETLSLWFEHNSDEFEDILTAKTYNI